MEVSIRKPTQKEYFEVLSSKNPLLIKARTELTFSAKAILKDLSYDKSASIEFRKNKILYSAYIPYMNCEEIENTHACMMSHIKTLNEYEDLAPLKKYICKDLFYVERESFTLLFGEQREKDDNTILLSAGGTFNFSYVKNCNEYLEKIRNIISEGPIEERDHKILSISVIGIAPSSYNLGASDTLAKHDTNMCNIYDYYVILEDGLIMKAIVETMY